MKASTPVLLCLALSGLARADVVAYDNFGPNTSYTGSSWIVYGPQSGPVWWTHAFPINPTVSGEVSTVTIPLFHMQGSPNSYILELRSDVAGSPGPAIGTLGTIAGFTVFGGPPVQCSAAPGLHITAGTPYWVYARSATGNSHAGWCASPTPGGNRAYSWDGGGSFTVESLVGGAQGAIRVEVAGATPPSCYANCDQSTVAPVLNVQDFTCFLNRFAAGETYANCDQSTVAPVLNVQDFTCFLNRFAAGCS